MTMILLALMCLLLYVALTRWRGHERAELGLGRGRVVAADDTRQGAPTLRSERYGLVGRPDHLVRLGHVLIPVEQKPSARRLQPSHVLQVAAQCLLVEEAYGVRPPYGVVALSGGIEERVPFTPLLERQLLATMAEMRQFLATGAEPGARWVAPKCRACAYQQMCWE
jgi:CRISPR-associated exonuclease Cas4